MKTNHRISAPFRRKSRAQGFTLIEVMLAIGVLACSVLPMVALMPQGVDSLRTSIRENAEARIQQEIVGRLSTTDWAASHDLADFDKSTWYFNDHGAPVKNETESLYTAYLEVSDSTLPGATDSNYYLRTVTINITDLPAAVHPFADTAKHRRFVATVAKLDK